MGDLIYLGRCLDLVTPFTFALISLYIEQKEFVMEAFKLDHWSFS